MRRILGVGKSTVHYRRNLFELSDLFLILGFRKCYADSHTYNERNG